MYPAKRKRLEQSHSSLRKPFRSPLASVSKSAIPSSTSSPLSRQPQSAALATSLNDVGSPQRKHTELPLRLKRLKQDLDVAKQALQIEKSGADDELGDLIDKWRIVAQEAADDLYTESKKRVEGMGGFAAWQRRQTEDYEFPGHRHRPESTQADAHDQEFDTKSCTSEHDLSVDGASVSPCISWGTLTRAH